MPFKDGETCSERLGNFLEVMQLVKPETGLEPRSFCFYFIHLLFRIYKTLLRFLKAIRESFASP